MAAVDDAPPSITWTPAKNVSVAKTTGVVVGGGLFAVGLATLPLPQLTAAAVVGLSSAIALGVVPVARAVPMMSWWKWFVFAFTYTLPIYLIGAAIKKEGAPSFRQALASFVLAFAVVGLCMSVCLHRYFAHQAFKTTRAFQMVLAIIGCHAFQGCPVWWASKHRRHHKHCDAPEDPHSWKQTSYMYAWLGWTMNPHEMSTDKEFVTKLLEAPELSFIGFFWWLWPLITCTAFYNAFGFYNTVVYLTTPMWSARIVTLVFNVEYHPPDAQSKLDTKHENANTGCLSLDMPRFLADCVGESCHDDHHSHPKRAKRPSGGFPNADLPYWIMIKPMLMLGLVWNPCDEYTAEAAAQ
eukprot:CAMPEP_0115854592 /NCGR_PEP_ID=MMETSP0287-20121206/14104_1 /TAXON_ID=412157 /ORGANISM="Chrysochromulina rotalis, Strain UIO044" /LENGTH=352 /DNA_ID=CAMNT_0003308715 /DNA_START=25 /DNA_END=1083 /DNA_ORIENTATION=+